MDSEPRYIGRAHSEDGVYILDFDIPDCSADSGDLINLQPQAIKWSRKPKHPGGRPWIKHHAHPREIDLHAPGPDGLCRNCRTPTASRTDTTDRPLNREEAPAEEGESSAAAARRLMAAATQSENTRPALPPAIMDIIEEAEWQTPQPTGMRDGKLAAALTIFQPRRTRNDSTVHERLDLLTRYTGPGAHDADNNPLPLTWETYHVQHPWSHRTMTTEEFQRHEEEERRRRADEEAKPAAAAPTGGWGSAAVTPRKWGSGTTATGWGTPPLTVDDEEPIEEAIARAEQEAAAAARGPYGSPRPLGIPLDTTPHTDSWGSSQHASSDSTNSRPPTDRDTILPYRRYPRSPLHTESTPIGPSDSPVPRPPATFTLPPHHLPLPDLPEGTADTDDAPPPLAALATITPTPTAQDVILALGHSISPQPIPEPTERDIAELIAFYIRSPALRAQPDLWHRRLGHPSQEVLNNCIRAQVFLPGTLLRPDGTPVPVDTTRCAGCDICPEAALTHQPFKLLEPGTNRYEKLEKVYSDFLVLTKTGLNGEEYTLTFVDAHSRFVWVANVSHRSKAFDIFKVWHANAETQSGCTLKLWQTDCSAEFKSDKFAAYIQEKGIGHKLSLPYAHPQQGVAERTNRTLMTKHHCQHRQPLASSQVHQQAR
ncbi:unnamed protein product [Closterium sp. Naga37s-1]|nr:unnamed protein product [Closterium sp. Naga37s-1]